MNPCESPSDLKESQEQGVTPSVSLNVGASSAIFMLKRFVVQWIVLCFMVSVFSFILLPPLSEYAKLSPMIEVFVGPKDEEGLQKALRLVLVVVTISFAISFVDIVLYWLRVRVRWTPEKIKHDLDETRFE